jgi:NADH-quinone oxidoreductase subunit L
MFAALAVGAWPAAIFHLVTHAAFKALLFLSSGSVIHGSGTQELREMGGLREKMPLTAVAWIVGALALAGIPPLAGFFSKDAVIGAVLNVAPISGVALLAASALTGAYMARATRLTFFGAPRGSEGAHDSPWTMTLPLGVLSLAALGLGFGGAAIVRALGAVQEPLSLGLAAVAVGLAAAGAVGGWLLAADGGAAEDAFAPGLARLWDTVRSGYRIDELVAAVVVRPVAVTARAVDAMVDRAGVDGVAEGVATLARRVGALLADTMNGDGQGYAGLLVGGAIIVLVVALWVVR